MYIIVIWAWAIYTNITKKRYLFVGVISELANRFQTQWSPNDGDCYFSNIGYNILNGLQEEKAFSNFCDTEGARNLKFVQCVILT